MPEFDDFEAQEDAFTLLRSKQIEKDSGRLSRAKQFAERKRDEFDQMAKDLPNVKRKPVNNGVHNSKMER